MPATTAPRISILMAIYNCADTLPEALDSLYNQTYRGFKLILCEDSSTDNTYAVAKEYADKHDNIVLLQNETNRKLPASLNRCLEYADTEYVARMDGDDISLPTRFEKELAFLDEHPEYALVSCSMIYFDEKGDWGQSSPNPTPSINSFLPRHGGLHAHAPMMMRTKIMKTVGGYTDHKYTQRSEDIYLWYKIYKAGYRGYNLQEPLYKMRNDKEARSRRTFKVRYYGFMRQRIIYKGLGFKFGFFRALPIFIKAFIPEFLMRRLSKWRMNRKNKS